VIYILERRNTRILHRTEAVAVSPSPCHAMLVKVKTTIVTCLFCVERGTKPG